MVLVLVGLREAVVNAIPLALKRAISVGIGLFILFIGLVNGGIVRPGQGIPVTLGRTSRSPGGGRGPPADAPVPRARRARRPPPRHPRHDHPRDPRERAPRRDGVDDPRRGGGAAVARGLAGLLDARRGDQLREVFARLGVLAACLAIFSIMLSDFFDTLGTVIGIGAEARWLDKAGRLPRMNRVLLVDSLAAAMGGAASASSATTYIESAAGVAAGGRTGLTSVVVAVCFALALFVAPLAGVVPRRRRRRPSSSWGTSCAPSCGRSRSRTWRRASRRS